MFFSSVASRCDFKAAKILLFHETDSFKVHYWYGVGVKKANKKSDAVCITFFLVGTTRFELVTLCL